MRNHIRATSDKRAAAVDCNPTVAESACLRQVREHLLLHLVRYHEQHDERFTNWLKHFDAMLWLKLAIVHLNQGLAITVEYDLRQYLKLQVSVGLTYFQRHALS